MDVIRGERNQRTTPCVEEKWAHALCHPLPEESGRGVRKSDSNEAAEANMRGHNWIDEHQGTKESNSTDSAIGRRQPQG